MASPDETAPDPAAGSRPRGVLPDVDLPVYRPRGRWVFFAGFAVALVVAAVTAFLVAR